MRIAYCVNLRLPSERAYGHHVARFCDALFRSGQDVTIYAPERQNPIAQDFWSYHQVDRRVQLRFIPAFDHVAFRWIPGALGLWLHNRSFIRHLIVHLREGKFDLLYTRTPALLPSLLSTGLPVAIELHTIPRWRKRRFASLCMRCRKVICLTGPIREEMTRLGVPERLLMVEGDAVEEDAFRELMDISSAKERFGIASDETVLGYAGSLMTMGLAKGVEQIIGAVAILRNHNQPVTALIAGGPPSALPPLQLEAIRLGVGAAVKFTGPLPHGTIPSVFAASDVLVYPAPKTDHPFFTRDTSPLKVFEYMASGRPMVAADLPPLRDIVDDGVAFLCAPGDPQSLADAVTDALSHPDAAQAKATKAKERVREHTWTKRAARILSAIA